MRRRLAAIFTILIGAIPSANSAEPTDWHSLKASTSPSDRKVVRNVESLEWWRACIEWGREERKLAERTPRGQALLWYLESRGYINGKDRGNAPSRTVDIGMTECGVFASKGPPDAINQTTTARGRSAQFVYGRVYIYTEPSNGPVNTVHAIQH